MIGMDGRTFIILSENVVAGMTGLTPGPAGSGLPPMAIFLIMTIVAVDRPQSPVGFMTLIRYSRMALPAGDFITMNRRRKRLDVYAAAASGAARLVAIHALLPAVSTELIGGKHDHQADQA
jgi:hypothetical protein